MTSPLHILLLEDDPLDAELNERALRKAGLTFVSQLVQSREEFLAALDSFEPDIILSDYGLPQYDGMRALEELRRRDPDLPFIFVSGAMGEARAVESLHRGANDYILKGQLTRLPAAVGHALEEAERAKKLRTAKAHYRGLFESMSDGVAIYQAVDDGADFIFLDMNPAGVRIGGLAREQIIGRPVTEVYPRVGEIGLLDVFRQVWRTGETVHHPITRYQDGRVSQWVENTVLRLPGGEVVAIYSDITEKMRLDEALRESEERFRALVETTSDWIWETDAQCCYTYASPRLLGLLGYVPEEVLGLTPFDLMAPEEATRVRNLFAPISAAHLPIRLLENRVLHKDGHEVVLETDGMPVFGPDGTFLGYRGSDRDITERKRMEADLLAERSRLRTLINTIPDLVCLKDPDGIYLACNPPFERFFGAKEHAIAGRTDYDFVNAELADSFCEHDRRAMAVGGPTNNKEWITLRDDGRRILLETIKTPMFGEESNLIGVLGVGRDITALHEAQVALESHRQELEREVAARTSELRETEARMRLILNSSADGIFGVDFDDRVTFINPAACAILGYTAEQLIGRSMHEAVHHSYADGSPYPYDQCSVSITLTEGRLLRVDDEVYWHADGHPIPVAYATHPMLHEGKVIGAVVSFNDISRQRETEAAREAALREAQRLARVRSEFLANMSHEIRTPLNSVLGFAQVGYRDSAGRKAQETFGRILDSGGILLGILNDILDFSKIEAGKFRLEQGTVSLGELLDSATAMVSKQAEEKGLAFRLEVSDEFPARCSGDSLRLSQVLVNLLSNALKFTEQGGITFGAERNAGELVFRITDTGIGMSEEQVARLFQPFEQVDGSITRRFGGSGLGLAISQRLTEMMGGKIGVESRPGEGTRFELRLPCSGESGRISEWAVRSARPAKQGPRLQGLSILAAEDNRVNRMVLEDMLVGEGCRLTLVKNGRQAVESVSSNGPAAFDVVLMDIQMPEMDGYEACRRIRELAPGLPVIGLTAHAMAEERDRCRMAGMVDHVAKPIVLDLLVDRIHRQMTGTPERDLPSTVDRGGAASDDDADGIPSIDWPTLEGRYTGREEFFYGLLTAIIQTHADTSTALRAAVHSADLDRLAKLTHSLKGMAGDVLPTLHRHLIAQTDSAVRSGAADAPRLALRLADLLDQQIHEISRYLEGKEPEQGDVDATEEDQERVADLLSRLETLVAGDDTAANPLLREVRPLMTLAFGDLARQLEREVNRFDYPNALVTLRKMMAEAGVPSKI